MKKIYLALPYFLVIISTIYAREMSVYDLLEAEIVSEKSSIQKVIDSHIKTADRKVVIKALSGKGVSIDAATVIADEMAALNEERKILKKMSSISLKNRVKMLAAKIDMIESKKRKKFETIEVDLLPDKERLFLRRWIEKYDEEHDEKKADQIVGMKSDEISEDVETLDSSEIDLPVMSQIEEELPLLPDDEELSSLEEEDSVRLELDEEAGDRSLEEKNELSDVVVDAEEESKDKGMSSSTMQKLLIGATVGGAVKLGMVAGGKATYNKYKRAKKNYKAEKTAEREKFQKYGDIENYDRKKSNLDKMKEKLFISSKDRKREKMQISAPKGVESKFSLDKESARQNPNISKRLVQKHLDDEEKRMKKLNKKPSRFKRRFVRH
ncbi:hypothetical protein COB28_03090 [Candidatus Dependentiae bacterium]|nr:MAG: hypothetical protein COB28_03090 [Candidatus Dependentiae bacterium]